MAKNNSRLTPGALATFVEVLGRTGLKVSAAEAIGVDPQTAARWEKRAKENPKDPAFTISDPLGEEPDIQFHEAVELAWKAWLQAVPEKTLIQLATGTHREPIVYKGRICYEPDLTASPLFDKESGTVYYPPKLDPITGEPIPLTIPTVREKSLHFLMEKRDERYKSKQEVDITTGGKPIVVPAKRYDTEQLLKEHGVTRVVMPKPGQGT